MNKGRRLNGQLNRSGHYKSIPPAVKQDMDNSKGNRKYFDNIGDEITVFNSMKKVYTSSCSNCLSILLGVCPVCRKGFFQKHIQLKAAGTGLKAYVLGSSIRRA